jgi:hypothetical protein
VADEDHVCEILESQNAENVADVDIQADRGGEQ